MRHNIAFLVLILLFTTLLTTSDLSNQPSTLERSNDGVVTVQNTKSSNDLVLNQVTSIVYDGVVSVGEYAIKEVLDPTFDIYYSTDTTTIYMALVGVATGYVSVGFGSPIMQNSDIIIGYFDGATNIRDTWAPGYSLTTDASQDIISSAAGETAGVTTLEFSRLLNTGDTTEDNVITIGVATDILWGYSANDDFISYHSARGATSIVFSSPPSSPQNLVATPLNAQVDLSWGIPASDGGSSIQSYNIYRSDISGGGYALAGTSTTLSFSDTTVNNDQTYYYVVRAENSMGEGSNSNEVSVLPTQSIPGPQNLIAVAGTSQVTLSWQPPTTDGGSPITHYNIYRSTTSGSGYSLLGQNTSALGYVDKDVVNAAWYYYIVTALNSFTESEYSIEGSAYPTGPPSPPLSLTSIAGSSNVTLNWTTPISDGGFPITHYTIYRSDQAGGPYTEKWTNSSTLGYFDGTALDTFTYYYVVVANNSAGGSDFSNEQKATLKNVPFASSDLDLEPKYNLTSSLARVVLNWTAVDSNGNPMVRYNIYRSNRTGITGDLIGNTSDGSVLNYTDLTTSSGVKYYYLVAGVNTQGEGAYSIQVSIITGTIPGAPQNTVVSPGNLQVIIGWSGVAEDGGLSILKYHVYSAESDTGPFTYVATTPQEAIVVSGLNNGNTYYFKISAENLKGNGTFSTIISAKPGSKPTESRNIIISAQDNTIKLDWTAPTNNGGYDILEYRVFWSTASGTSYSFIGVNSSVLGFETTNGIVGVTYYFVIRSVNIFGESVFSSEKSISLSEVPSSPRNLTGMAGNEQILLNWLVSENTGGTPIIQYQVYRSNVSGSGYEKINSVIGNLSYVDNSVTNNLTYYYVINSQNIVGDSDFSNEIGVEPFDPYASTTTESSISSTSTPSETGSETTTETSSQSNTDLSDSKDSGSGIDISPEQFFITIGFFVSLTTIGVTIRFLRKQEEV